VAQRRYSLHAAAAIKRLRYLGAWFWDCERFGVWGAGCSGSPGSVVAVRRLMDTRAHCLAMAKHYKRVADRAIADNLRAFDRVLDGIHSKRFGDLRHVLGLVDRKGRERGASKINPAMIGRARGKLASKRSLAATLALPVGRAKRALPCAIVSGGAVTMDGPQGFALVRRPAAR